MAPFPRIFTKNWQLKSLAVAVAVLLWTVPRFERQSTRILDDIPLAVDLGSPGWTLVDQSHATVSVTVSGPARDLIALDFSRPPVLVPVGEVLANDTTVFLNRNWFRVQGLDGVVVETIRPEAVRLTFDQITERRVPLSAPTYGELPDSISLTGSPEVMPDMASVIGPATQLEDVDSVMLVAINLSGVTGADTISQRVDTAGFSGFQVLPEEALVFFPVESTEEREVSDLALDLPRMASDPQLQVRPAEVSVVLYGAGSLLARLDLGNIRAFIPATAATLPPGGEERVLVSVDGVPAPLRYRVVPESVILRRPVGQ